MGPSSGDANHGTGKLEGECAPRDGLGMRGTRELLRQVGQGVFSLALSACLGGDKAPT